ncbi:MAG: tetratricopeptide repeat protein, partial [Bacteroidota bacterium]
MNQASQISFRFLFVLLFGLCLGQLSSPLSAQRPAKMDSLQSLLRAATESERQVDLLVEIGWAWWGTSADSAEWYCQKARAQAAATEYRLGMAKANHRLGILVNDDGKYKEAIAFFREALQHYAWLDRTDKVAGMLGNIGKSYRLMGDFGKALEFHLRSIRQFETLGDREGQAIELVAVGAIYHVQHRYDKAIEYYRAALEISDRSKHPMNTCSAYINLGDVFIFQDRLAEAAKNYQAGLELARDIQ